MANQSLPVTWACNNGGAAATPDSATVALLGPDFEYHTVFGNADELPVSPGDVDITGLVGHTFTIADTDAKGQYQALCRVVYGAKTILVKEIIKVE